LLISSANLQKGQTIVVHAAAGGVGISAVQIAKAQGARVIATVGSDDKFKIVTEAGAGIYFPLPKS
jgi:NADPH2:quinone reductase